MTELSPDVNTMTDPLEIQWLWMMDWCKQKGLAPARPEIWQKALEAYWEANRAITSELDP